MSNSFTEPTVPHRGDPSLAFRSFPVRARSWYPSDVAAQCEACSASFPDVEGLAFCPSCGSPVDRPGDEPGPERGSSAGDVATDRALTAEPSADDAIRVCAACGIIAPTERRSCLRCGADISAAPAVPRRADGCQWVQIIANFQCRTCGHRTFLVGLDLDGQFTCGGCGLLQAFDPDVWTEALAYGHAVADLSGPHPEGRFPGRERIAEVNDLARIGVDGTSLSHRQTGMTTDGAVVRSRALDTELAPGHPLCRSCATPLDAERHGSGDLESVCRGCGDRARYRLPTGASELARGLEGILADDHRADAQEAKPRASSAGAVVALECPKCSAVLEVGRGDHFAVCGYCRTPVRISSKTRFALQGTEEPPQPFWLLFQGVSEHRRALEAQVKQTAAAERKRAEERAQAKRARAESLAKKQGEALLLKPEPRERDLGEAALGLFVPLVVLALVGGTLFDDYIARWTDPTEEPRLETGIGGIGRALSSMGSGGDEVPPATSEPPADPLDPTGPLPRSDFVTLAGCSCEANMDGDPALERVQLAVHAEPQPRTGADDASTRWTLQYYLDLADRSVRLQPAAESAPPAEIVGQGLAIGVACTRNIAVFVAGGRATGWSPSGARLWSTPVDGWNARPGTGEELSFDCKPLATRKGVVRVRGPGRKKTFIRMASGEVL
jgi:Zn finger protein HypA/HybF involved in hydrogenase expression